MKILPIIASNHPGKNLVNFNADVTILPNTAKGNQPTEDKFILEDETKKIQKELQKRFPSKNDNIQIFLQPNGFRSASDKKLYWNQITAYMGYKDAERARQEIIQKNITPPSDDYVLLEKETMNVAEIRKLLELPAPQEEVKAEVKRLTEEMKNAARMLEFEYAAQIRDKIAEITGKRPS